MPSQWRVRCVLSDQCVHQRLGIHAEPYGDTVSQRRQSRVKRGAWSHDVLVVVERATKAHNTPARDVFLVLSCVQGERTDDLEQAGLLVDAQKIWLIPQPVD